MRRLFAIAALLAGCSPGKNFDGFDTALDTGGGDIPEGTLRLDIVPPTSAGDGTLLPQSVIVPPGLYEGQDVTLLPTRTITGTLTADVARGWNLGPPTTDEPLVATLQTLPGDGRLGGAAQSAEDGTFTLSYPEYPPGRFPIAIVPHDASMAPIRVVAAPTSGSTWDQHLAPGIPVYGRVTGVFGGEETGLGGVTMRIARIAGDDVVTSGTFTTDATGWYVARVDETGDYTLQVVGGPTATPDQVAPALSLPVLVEGEEGVEVPVPLGAVRDATAYGVVLDSEGDRLAEARVRFTSVSLDGGGSLVVETDASRDGEFISSSLLPGVYDIEVMAPAGPAAVATPVRLENRRIYDGTNLGSIPLLAPGRLEGVVDDVNGDVAGQVLVVATEAGFGGSVYYTYTDGSGHFDLAVPGVPLTVTLTPASPTSGAVTIVDVPAPGAGQDFRLEDGVAVNGTLSFGDAPVAFSSVEVRDAASGVLLGQAISDQDGNFSLRVSVPTHDTDTVRDTGDTGDTGRDTADTGRDTADTADTSDTGVPPDTADTGRDTADTSGRDTADTAAR